MAHVITVEIGEGCTDECKVCPFSIEVGPDDGLDRYSCGLPESFPDCDDVNYAEMQVINN